VNDLRRGVGEWHRRRHPVGEPLDLGHSLPGVCSTQLAGYERHSRGWMAFVAATAAAAAVGGGCGRRYSDRIDIRTVMYSADVQSIDTTDTQRSLALLLIPKYGIAVKVRRQDELRNRKLRGAPTD
jgi:hypothetical protein